MQPHYWFVLVFLCLFFSIGYFDVKFHMLRDTSAANPRPYSFARVQLAWWTLIVLSSFITIIIVKDGLIPTFDSSTLILLGISAATTASARIIDVSEQARPNIVRHQNDPGNNFFLDILSDENGVSIHRFQTIVFTLTFGVWFIIQVLGNLKGGINTIIPVFEDNNLVLMGLSNGVYAALKTTENKTNSTSVTDSQPEFVPNEAETSSEKAQG